MGHFIPLRDFHIHQIIDWIFNLEFNLEELKNKELIEDAYPLHEFRTRNNIIANW